MRDLTRILQSIDSGDPRNGGAAEELLPLVYDELRRLAAARMAHELPGQTLQPTALVHEAWLRLSGDQAQQWDNRGHFFAAAAQAMRCILVDKARYKKRQRHGGGHPPSTFDEEKVNRDTDLDEDLILAVDEALDELEHLNPQAARIVKLRYFVGLTMEEAASAMDLSLRSTERLWSYAKAWLRRKLNFRSA